MPAFPFTPQTPVAKVLELAPKSALLFISAAADCVGCILAQFCTLKEMSIHYGVDLEDFIRKLEELEVEA